MFLRGVAFALLLLIVGCGGGSPDIPANNNQETRSGPVTVTWHGSTNAWSIKVFYPGETAAEDQILWTGDIAPNQSLTQTLSFDENIGTSRLAITYTTAGGAMSSGVDIITKKGIYEFQIHDWFSS